MGEPTSIHCVAAHDFIAYADRICWAARSSGPEGGRQITPCVTALPAEDTAAEQFARPQDRLARWVETGYAPRGEVNVGDAGGSRQDSRHMAGSADSGGLGGRPHHP